MKKKRKKGDIIFAILVVLSAGCSEVKEEEISNPPKSIFSNAMPKRFLNPEKILGGSFSIISESDTITYSFRYNKVDKSSLLTIIDKNDTASYSPVFLNRHRELYFINYRVEEDRWKIISFSLGDSTITGINPNYIFDQLHQVDEKISKQEFKSLIQNESENEILINADKKDLYKLFSTIMDSSTYVYRLSNRDKVNSPNFSTSDSDTVSQEDKSININIFPNPASEKVIVSNISKDWIVAIKDSDDEAVQVKIAQKDFVEFDLAGIKGGNYYVYIFDPESKKKYNYQLLIQ